MVRPLPLRSTLDAIEQKGGVKIALDPAVALAPFLVWRYAHHQAGASGGGAGNVIAYGTRELAGLIAGVFAGFRRPPARHETASVAHVNLSNFDECAA